MKNIISIFLLLTSLSLPVYSQPTVNGQFMLVTNNGTNYVVKVQISTNTGTDILGDATIPFTFDNTNLTYVNTLFNNFSGGDYYVATATIYTNRISLNIVLNNTSGGTVVSNTYMDVATVTFSTFNSAGPSNLTFVSPLEFFSPNITPPAEQWTIGTFTDLNTNPLPVELSSFTASSKQNGVELNWQTATEVNNYGFDVERTGGSLQSSVGKWEKIGFVNGNGNSNSPKHYSFEDKNVVNGKYSYRLKQIDNDGQYEYSNVIEVDLGNAKEYSLLQNYPNPFNPSTKIEFRLPEKQMVILRVYNMLGEMIKNLINEEKEAGTYSVTFDGIGLTSGLYIYRLETANYVANRKMSLVK